jgi:ATP-dependent exoDNAse (exonuclease V) alpha subunit
VLDEGLATADTIGLTDVEHYSDEEKQQAIQWLFPEGIHASDPTADPEEASNSSKNCVLCVTNESVDEWNTLIQGQNKQEAQELLSHDEFADVDDDNGILDKLLSRSVKEGLNAAASVPPHVLSLKVNDTCLVLRSLKANNIPTNARLKIMRIRQYSIIGQLIDDNNRVVTIPRIRFNFSMAGGHNFTIRRTQFPLRLAYAMTVNKCQGQTLSRVLLDCTTMMFSHGHLYVALSRVRSRNSIKFFCNNACILANDNETEVIVKNVYYSSLLDKFLLNYHD